MLAETAVRVIADAQDSLATKSDLAVLRNHVDAKLETRPGRSRVSLAFMAGFFQALAPFCQRMSLFPAC